MDEQKPNNFSSFDNLNVGCETEVPCSDLTAPSSDLTAPSSDLTTPSTDLTAPSSDLTVSHFAESTIEEEVVSDVKEFKLEDIHNNNKKKTVIFSWNRNSPRNSSPQISLNRNSPRNSPGFSSNENSPRNSPVENLGETKTLVFPKSEQENSRLMKATDTPVLKVKLVSGGSPGVHSPGTAISSCIIDDQENRQVETDPIVLVSSHAPAPAAEPNRYIAAAAAAAAAASVSDDAAGSIQHTAFTSHRVEEEDSAIEPAPAAADVGPQNQVGMTKLVLVTGENIPMLHQPLLPQQEQQQQQQLLQQLLLQQQLQQQLHLQQQQNGPQPAHLQMQQLLLQQHLQQELSRTQMPKPRQEQQQQQGQQLQQLAQLEQQQGQQQQLQQQQPLGSCLSNTNNAGIFMVNVFVGSDGRIYLTSAQNAETSSASSASSAACAKLVGNLAPDATETQLPMPANKVENLPSLGNAQNFIMKQFSGVSDRQCVENMGHGSTGSVVMQSGMAVQHINQGGMAGINKYEEPDRDSQGTRKRKPRQQKDQPILENKHLKSSAANWEETMTATGSISREEVAGIQGLQYCYNTSPSNGIEVGGEVQGMTQLSPRLIPGSTGSNASTKVYICTMCNKEFISEKYLSMHMSIHSELSRGMSDALLQLPPDLNILDRKAMIESPIRRIKGGSGTQAQWTCKICNKIFAQNSNYKNHIRTHSNERPFVCEICSIGFKERYHLKKHVLFKHTQDMKEECKFCGKQFKDSTAVRAHERTHSDERPYSCPRCQKTFKTSECLWHHENRSKTCGKSQGEISPSVPIQRPARRTRQQRQQPQTPVLREPAASEMIHPSQIIEELPSIPILPKDNAVESHQFMQIETGNHVVPVRYEEYVIHDARQSQLFAANNNIAAVKVESEVNLMDYDLTGITTSDSSLEGCNDLDFDMDDEEEEVMNLIKTDFQQQQQQQHQQQEHQELLTFQQNSELTNYPASSSQQQLCQVKQFGCVYCTKSFSTHSALDKHVVAHSEDRPHECSSCNVRFKLKVHLKKHMLYRHSDEYPCECSICGKRFKDSSAVRLHERIHSTDRPFKCRCGKSFKTRENLWGHRHRGPCESASPSEEFLLQNLRLFQSDIGPIWGVPIREGNGVFGVNELQSAVEVHGEIHPFPQQQQQLQEQQQQQTFFIESVKNAMIAAKTSELGLQTFAQSSACDNNLPSLSIQSIPSGTIQVVHTSNGTVHISNGAVHTSNAVVKRTNETQTSSSANFLPTAVVVPIKRDKAENIFQEIQVSASSSVASAINEKCLLPPFHTFVPANHRPQQSPPSQDQISASHSNEGQSAPSASGSATVAARCPTVQKFLSTSQPESSRRLPGIQQLFKNHQMATMDDNAVEQTGSSIGSVLTNPQFSLFDGRVRLPSNQSTSIRNAPVMNISTASVPIAIMASSQLVGNHQLPNGVSIGVPNSSGTSSAGMSVVFWDEEAGTATSLADRKPATITAWPSDNGPVYGDLSTKSTFRHI